MHAENGSSLFKLQCLFSISEYTLLSAAAAADDDDVCLRGKSFALIERVCNRRKLETSFSLLFFPPFFFSSCCGSLPRSFDSLPLAVSTCCFPSSSSFFVCGYLSLVEFHQWCFFVAGNLSPLQRTCTTEAAVHEDEA